MDAIATEIKRAGKRATVNVGLDLGKVSDFTAVVVSERLRRPDDDRMHHTARMIERMPLGTSYPDIADRVAEIMANLEALKATRDDLGTVRLIVDSTGVGIAAIDLLKERGLKPVAVTITGTNKQTEHDTGVLSVGKTFMVSKLQVLLQSGRLHLPKSPEAAILIDELKDYQLEYTNAGNVTFNARSGKHDDLVLALALAVTVDVPRGKPKPPASAIGIHGVAKPPSRDEFGKQQPGKGTHYKRKVWG